MRCTRASTQARAIGYSVELFDPSPTTESGMLTLNEQQARPVSTLGRVGLCCPYQQVADLSVGNENLLTIDAPLVAIVVRAGADCRKIAVGVGSGHPDGVDSFSTTF